MMKSLKVGFGRFHLASATVLLFLTGVAKLVSAGGSSAILEDADPIVGVQTRWLLITLGILELGTIVLIIVSHDHRLPSLIVAILGAQFLWYRAVFQIGGYTRGCPCLGSFAEWTNLSQATINNMLWTIAAWLCFGGILSFFGSFDSRTNQALGVPAGSHGR